MLNSEQTIVAECATIAKRHRTLQIQCALCIVHRVHFHVTTLRLVIERHTAYQTHGRTPMCECAICAHLYVIYEGDGMLRGC